MIKTTPLKDLFIIEGGQTFEDERGFFREPFRRDEFEKHLGHSWVHVQENHAYSKKNVLRGIHIAPWDKIVYVPFGNVLSVIVDLRRDSPTFKMHFKTELGDGNRVKIFIPAGFGNSYFVLSEESVYEYQVNKYWERGLEKGIIWNDPELNIDWGGIEPILSEKDRNNPTFKQFLENL